ncbi:MAG TPA: VWA domain-containing protein [Pirellulaceae bacterium]|nr:VWA domain-containing protein [Pirellulaceae bacterium]
MKITCIKCDRDFVITADQLGTRGKCPHCKATIILPRAETRVQSKELERPKNWFDVSLSSIGSILLHAMALLVLLLIPWGGYRSGEGGAGDVVQLGVLDEFELTLTEQPSLEFSDVVQQHNVLDTLRNLENSLSPTNFDPLADQMMILDRDLKVGSLDETAEMSTSLPRSMALSGSENFGELVSRLQRDGLDIVITFDSTGSMEGEIRQVKGKIERMGMILFQLIPKTRISICTYRDVDDDYIVKGLPLTSNLGEVIEYLETVSAGGGGDIPEAVDAGLAWSIQQNRFRPRARKVILLFGDAPPHQVNYNRCLRLAAEFHENLGGIVNTVTCQSDRRLPSFIEIAKIGGGEAFLARDEREIMTQLMILVFGSQHREKVLEAFNLLGN